MVSFGIMSRLIYREVNRKHGNVVKPSNRIKDAQGMPSRCPEFYRSMISADGTTKCVIDAEMRADAMGERNCTLRRDDWSSSDPKIMNYVSEFDLKMDNVTPSKVCAMKSEIPWSSASAMDIACGGETKWECMNKTTLQRMFLKNPLNGNLTPNQATEECNKLAPDDAKGQYVAQLI